MLRTDQGQPIRLEDYRPTDFDVHDVGLTFRLFAGETEVDALFTLERRDGVSAEAPIDLVGDDLVLEGVTLDGEALEPGRYEATPDRLVVRGLPENGTFRLGVKTRIRPETNTKLMGLYRSNGVWCTQCEAEGFRRITYFYDRPDVLATYRVRIEADKAEAPVLLSNGNPGEHGPLDGGRHFAVWDDPFRKPSYLFALVAGDLDRLDDHFTTMSGRKVDLAIYTEKGRAHESLYAMDALKRSMVWDERRFGREYDLDVFNIVAISDFNMGAMENKGLNVFNHKYVLLDPNTASDADYSGVETVIAHEYFHNWTGNRITCRDWFQLCLKEGLTVYRDQEFTADERSAPVKRISSVRGLKAHQFPEDQGPLQHPVRPSTYREISNFYTSTIYDKGAELVRMIATILGREDFRAGMDLYFERHDGDAATIEDFIRCFEEASGTDLGQFSLWYHQAGTPTLTVEESFDEAAGRLTLKLAQALKPGPAGTGTAPMHIPIRFGLVGSNGQDMDAEPAAGAEVEGDVIHLREAEETVVFEGLSERPYLSVLRDFSAPVDLKFRQRDSDRLALARLDTNPFNRWRALSDLVGEALERATRSARGGGEIEFDAAVADALVATAGDEALDPALRAQALALPSESDIARLLGDNVDPDAIHVARREVVRSTGQRGLDRFRALREGLIDAGAFSPDAASAGRRALANVLLDFIVAAEGSPKTAADAYAKAGNMTDRLAALSVLAHRFPEAPETDAALADFYARFEDNALVIDKWFTLQATAPFEGALARVRSLAAHPKFNLANPNRARSLIGAFAAGNQVGFNRADGAGYAWVAEMIQSLDELNPQIAARIATAFRSWRCFEAGRRETARSTLVELAGKTNLSVDLRDIVDRSLS
ncbi:MULTISPECIES: aminopeptidase N [unclassified Aureimonas]|uniref:aminopeptidase N n=1 Tax=unclassified Aureimonas TaxID=2615206 RepID=UPI0006F37FCF|nr:MULTISPECIES: aminopeptidase N [unclassified Aureimonas]KQT55286.1 aminopeptidase [Aureimonas sp. Leaf427]KQT71078.1 aminopeptidase [Aureimonas sp. Leaf460]